ncbi:MAG: VanZ family protein [Bacteroidales bacterium]|jgi:predicted membrane channel-forming protein YqfA (hemolysin III family)|nr:VanZ family protein [Bacteroidales bacterium]
MNLRTIFAILFFILLAVMLALTYYPDLPDLKVRIRNEWFRLDYIGHLGFYAAISASFITWRTGWRGKIPGILIFFTILAGVATGIITEFSQLAIPGRSFNPVDMVYNLAGVLAGVAVVYALSRKGGKVVRW